MRPDRVGSGQWSIRINRINRDRPVARKTDDEMILGTSPSRNWPNLYESCSEECWDEDAGMTLFLVAARFKN